jgi:16S rRNA (uracil1498-N3)-methyltransferase
VPRRFHTPRLSVGEIRLDAVQAHHAREVLRLSEGDWVELFDSDGAVAPGLLVFQGSRDVIVRVDRLADPLTHDEPRVIVASAVPKGERADWMVEKLSELGVAVFVPLMTERSVVKPDGKNKFERWNRIATESAKQSHRNGVMRIEELVSVKEFVAKRMQGSGGAVFYLSSGSQSSVLTDLLVDIKPSKERILLIGPEGGWTNAEMESFDEMGVIGAKLTSTILRVETAAIAAAGIAIVLAAVPITNENARRSPLPPGEG